MVIAALLLPGISRAKPVVNLRELTEALDSAPQAVRDLDLDVTVCAASRPEIGVVIVEDKSGVELLEMGDVGRQFSPGERVRIRHDDCLLRRREMGVQISANPLINDDGLHSGTVAQADAGLIQGKIPLRVDWFNYWYAFGLNVAWCRPAHTIQASNLWHAVVSSTGITNYLPGLQAEDYEGSWDSVPDFNLLNPAKTGEVTNIDLGFRSRNEGVGIRYSGYLDVPTNGNYHFVDWSDDGSMVFLGDPQVPLISLGSGPAPDARSVRVLNPAFGRLDDRFWTVVDGSVGFVARAGRGLRFTLRTDQQVISVLLADATGLDPSELLNARVRATGAGRWAMTFGQRLVLGKLFIASVHDLAILDHPFGAGPLGLPITSVFHIQSLPASRAQQSLPVRIRGIVTGATKSSREHWMSLQDESRGIFVTLTTLTNQFPAVGELWEVEGHTAPGNFAPVVNADRITRLGEGILPEPINPTWIELLNGSQDVQWAELTGVVSGVESNTITLNMLEGSLKVEMEGNFESDLKPFLNANVRIRGVLYAVWDSATREVRVGRVMMRNSQVSVDIPAPQDPFDAVLRKPRDLLLFDPQASAYRPVKVRGQIDYVDDTQLFLEDEGANLRLLPLGIPQVHPGDFVEAVGYPDIRETQMQLHDVRLRKIGEAPLPAPLKLDASAPAREALNLDRVRVEGKLLGWHSEAGAPVLEMQSGNRFFLARIAPEDSDLRPLATGSRLGLMGVYVEPGHRQSPSEANESFELLLNSQADITVLSRPPWWTLPRLLGLLGVLSVILAVTVIWNSQLRRLAEQRAAQLKHEISERERAEHQRVLEAERSRIARDLHDDLGSSLTEISVLAATGQLRHNSADQLLKLFQTIGIKARSLISALDVIVWAVDPEDNSLQSLADYLSGYADDFFSHTTVTCRFKVPVSFPAVNLEGRVRHDFLMAVKESFNNVIRHASASEVEFRMALRGASLEVEIADNGKGIADPARGVGHGLKNLTARLRQMGGDCIVAARTGGGTLVTFRLPLSAATKSSAGKSA